MLDQTTLDRLGPWTTRFKLHGQAVGGGYEVSEDDPLLRAFIDRAPMARRVLELGCMEGGRTFPLARRAGHVVGVDARRAARSRWPDALGMSSVLMPGGPHVPAGPTRWACRRC